MSEYVFINEAQKQVFLTDLAEVLTEYYNDSCTITAAIDEVARNQISIWDEDLISFAEENQLEPDLDNIRLVWYERNIQELHDELENVAIYSTLEILKQEYDVTEISQDFLEEIKTQCGVLTPPTYSGYLNQSFSELAENILVESLEKKTDRNLVKTSTPEKLSALLSSIDPEMQSSHEQNISKLAQTIDANQKLLSALPVITLGSPSQNITSAMPIVGGCRKTIDIRQR